MVANKEYKQEVISIGICGHRYLTEIEKLEAGIDQALIRIERTFPDELWSVLSSLAEGADQLVVRRIYQYKPSARLIVPLPLPVEDYLREFPSEESQREFLHLFRLATEIIQPAAVGTREAGYLAAGQHILNLCDVLIAVWDGQGAQGKGGTGDLAIAARQKRLPLAWVHCGNRKPGMNESTSLGNDQGSLSFENF